MGLLLAIYGSLLSTALAVLTIVKFLREGPRISVDAIPITAPASESDETHGVLVRVRREDDVLWEEADIEIRVRNAGDQACRISGVFVETATVIQQVRPNGLPVILDPNISCSIRVQPEYFALKTPTDEGDSKIFRSRRSVFSMRSARSTASPRRTWQHSSAGASDCRFGLLFTSTMRPVTWSWPSKPGMQQP